MQFSRRQFAATALMAAAATPLRAEEREPAMKRADIGGGVMLHYVEAGAGEPLIFVHGSLGDLGYWSDQMAPFAQRVRVIAYSRRYNYPNQNAAIRGYSAVVDASDLARLIERLRLGPCHIVGHSYGALTALFLAAERPELVRTLTLAEPPAVSLLRHVPAPDTARGEAMFADIGAHLVAPMRAAFDQGRREEGVRIFVDYVLQKPGAWDAMSPLARAETLRDADEWDIMMPFGTLFPTIDPEAVRRIHRPTLILSGARSYPFLGLIDEALLALLPDRRRIVFSDAGHQMWLQHPDGCRKAVFELMDRTKQPARPAAA